MTHVPLKVSTERTALLYRAPYQAYCRRVDARMTPRDLNAQERHWAEASDSTVRLSFDVEDSEDQIEDLRKALAAV